MMDESAKPSEPTKPAGQSAADADKTTPLEPSASVAAEAPVEPEKKKPDKKKKKRIGEASLEYHTEVLSKLSEDERHYFMSLAGLSSFMRSTSRLFWTNFLMGLARGIGFVIGMSIIGAICVGIWNELISVTGIGQLIARIIEEIQNNAPK